MFNSLRVRNRQPEVMDQPDLDQAIHRQALHGLARINFVSRSADILWPAIAALPRKMDGSPLTILDIASGGGDVTLGLWRRAQLHRVPVKIVGYDFSAVAVEHARQHASKLGADVDFQQVDVFAATDIGQFDVIVTSLFLHHLDEPQALDLLKRMRLSARHLVLVNDLRRSVTGLLAAHVVARLITRSEVVHVDGPLSVQGAFTVDELRELADQAGLSGARISRRWPFRMLLAWSP